MKFARVRFHYNEQYIHICMFNVINNDGIIGCCMELPKSEHDIINRLLDLNCHCIDNAYHSEDKDFIRCSCDRCADYRAKSSVLLFILGL